MQRRRLNARTERQGDKGAQRPEHQLISLGWRKRQGDPAKVPPQPPPGAGWAKAERGWGLWRHAEEPGEHALEDVGSAVIQKLVLCVQMSRQKCGWWLFLSHQDQSSSIP